MNLNIRKAEDEAIRYPKVSTQDITKMDYLDEQAAETLLQSVNILQYLSDMNQIIFSGRGLLKKIRMREVLTEMGIDADGAQQAGLGPKREYAYHGYELDVRGKYKDVFDGVIFKRKAGVIKVESGYEVRVYAGVSGAQYHRGSPLFQGYHVARIMDYTISGHPRVFFRGISFDSPLRDIPLSSDFVNKLKSYTEGRIEEIAREVIDARHPVIGVEK